MPVGPAAGVWGCGFPTSNCSPSCASLVFAKATRRARALRCSTFEHLHALSLRFHLERQTGGMTRDIGRGTGVQSLISYSALQHRAHADRGGDGALTLLGTKFEAWHVVNHAGACCTSPSRSVVTEWRTKFPARDERGAGLGVAQLRPSTCC